MLTNVPILFIRVMLHSQCRHLYNKYHGMSNNHVGWVRNGQ